MTLTQGSRLANANNRVVKRVKNVQQGITTKTMALERLAARGREHSNNCLGLLINPYLILVCFVVQK